MPICKVQKVVFELSLEGSQGKQIAEKRRESIPGLGNRIELGNRGATRRLVLLDFRTVKCRKPRS